MDKHLQKLSISQLNNLLTLERKKFLKALDYNSSPGILEEIIETIKLIERIIDQKENKSNNNQQVA